MKDNEGSQDNINTRNKRVKNSKAEETSLPTTNSQQKTIPTTFSPNAVVAPSTSISTVASAPMFANPAASTPVPGAFGSRPQMDGMPGMFLGAAPRPPTLNWQFPTFQPTGMTQQSVLSSHVLQPPPPPRVVPFAPSSTGMVFHAQGGIPSNYQPGASHSNPMLSIGPGPSMGSEFSSSKPPYSFGNVQHGSTFSPMFMTSSAGPLTVIPPGLGGRTHQASSSSHHSMTPMNPFTLPGNVFHPPPGIHAANNDARNAFPRQRLRTHSSAPSDGVNGVDRKSSLDSSGSDGLADRKKKRVHIRAESPGSSSLSNNESGASSLSGINPSSALASSAGGTNNSEFNGEGRLLIHFESFGSLVDPPPRIGKKGVIPNGIKGEFSSYGERWHFCVKYGETIVTRQGNPLICIEWNMKNDSWDHYHSVEETVHDAMKREDRGVTLCNRVFTEALETRAREYEDMLREEESKANPNELKIANLTSRIKTLRPRRISEGPLLFGLRHRMVQDHFCNLLTSGVVPSAIPPSETRN